MCAASASRTPERAGPRAASGGRGAAWVVGIDLGTTHTVVACAPLGDAAGSEAIRLFDIDQLVAPGEVAALPLLPSVRYHPAPGELAEGDLALPWTPDDPVAGAVIGRLARQRGAQVPGRLVASAKSWLSHGAVDRLAPILPWGAGEDVARVSPVQASASYLAHLRAAWNHRHPAAPLEDQEVVLTVPASFDDAARSLTVEAARDAGLPRLRLLEEPQAALYDWLFRHRDTLSDALAGTRLVLVCDVGGGTTDLSLVRVEHDGATPRLARIAVGRHLMLGGDNMDLALAHLAESRLPGATGARLSPGQLAQLVERCRDAKERLLAADAPASTQVTLLGAGARLIGAARSATLERAEVERIVVDGFFPRGEADDGPRRGRAGGLVAFGLPYASDPAVTRHVAGFLREHADAGWPDAVLLNGGVFRAEAIAARLQATLGDWRGAPPRSLHNADPDVAVARGAVAYALARRGRAPRIGGGSPRSYFLPLDASRSRAVCVLPQGSEEGREVRLEGRSFELRVGEPVRFDLVSTTDGAAGGVRPRAGDLVELGAREVQPLPPVATVVRAQEGAARRPIAVALAATLSEVGTLDVQCIALDDPTQRWQLAFELRGDAAPGATSSALPPRFPEAVEAIERVFGARDRSVGPRDVKQLRGRLESLLGGRERWPTAWLRPLHDALWQRAGGRHRSADHERLWFSLAGWCLRPGFGDPLDGWRIDRLWPLFERGVRHGNDRQVRAEWWTFWRRVAGGLDAAAQERLLQDFALNLQGDEAGIVERPAGFVAGAWDEMVRLGASLERVPVAHKVEIGEWLLERVRGLAAGHGSQAGAVWTLWALGRIGARSPLYGSAHGVVPAETAAAWLDVVLTLDWKQVEGAAAAAAHLARRSGDRVRDLPHEVRERVVARLQAHRAPPAWSERVREVVVLDEAGERGVFGESLPPGLRLIG